MLTISKIGDKIIVNKDNETLTFSNCPTINRKKNTVELSSNLKRDDLLFLELNRLWKTFTKEEEESVWIIYDQISQLTTEPDNVRREVIPGLMLDLITLHTPDRFKELYPLEKVWYPDKLKNDYKDLDSNYSEEMTYRICDYYDLIIYTLCLKPLIIPFVVLDSYLTGRGQSKELKRKVVDSINYCYDIVADSYLGDHPAAHKLEEYLEETVSKIQKELSSGGKNQSGNISLVAAIEGFGIDALNLYILSFTVINILALQPVGDYYKSEVLEENSLVIRIYYGVSHEIKKGYFEKITDQSIFEKEFAGDVIINGEKGKTSVVDLIIGRSRAPIKESIRTEEQFYNYGVILDRLNIGLDKTTTDIFISSVLNNHKTHWSEVHEWLVALILHRFADRRTYKDIEHEPMQYAVGLAQAIYWKLGFSSIAIVLGCTLYPGNIGVGYGFDIVDNELKKELDIYYPQGYERLNTSVVRNSVQLLVKDYINPFYFNLKVSHEVAKLLNCEVESENILLPTNFMIDLHKCLLYVNKLVC